MKIFFYFLLSFSIVVCSKESNFLKYLSQQDITMKCQCHAANLDKEKEPLKTRIIDAYKLPKVNIDNVVSLVNSGDGSYSYCGGLYINDYIILTTAHCGQNIAYDLKNYKACVGKSNIAQRIKNNRCKKIKDYLIYHKLALVSVEETLNPDQQFFDSCLHFNSTSLLEDFSVKVYATGSGFIKQNINVFAEPEEKAPTSIGFREFFISDDSCSNGDSEITCITNKDSSVCYGDSGYPVYAIYKNKYLAVLGLISKIKDEDDNCEKWSSHGFIKFDNYYTWLKKNTQSLMCSTSAIL